MTALKHFRDDILKLYLIISEADVNPKNLEDSVLAAVKGGVTLIQLRDKTGSDEEFLAQAARIQPILKAHNVPLIINDRLHLVKQAGADGVHLGQSDGDPAAARALLGNDKIIGLSITEHVPIDSVPCDVIDYIGLYPIFSTATKLDAGHALGLKHTAEIIKSIDIPVVGIGGITANFARQVLDTGCVGVSVISAICGAQNIETASSEFINAMN